MLQLYGCLCLPVCLMLHVLLFASLHRHVLKVHWEEVHWEEVHLILYRQVHWEEWGLLKLHSWFPFEVGPLCVLICGSIARYVVDSLFYSLWLHLFCVVLSVFLPLSVWRPRHSLRDRHVRRTLARTLAPMVVHWLIVVMDNIGRYVHHIFLWLAKNLRHHKCSVECFFSWTITMFN